MHNDYCCQYLEALRYNKNLLNSIESIKQERKERRKKKKNGSSNRIASQNRYFLYGKTVV